LRRALHFAALDQATGREAALVGQPHITHKAPSQGPKVLVAEDNATNRKIIAQILEYGGFAVTLATTGPHAVEALKQQAFDVVILDKHMPGMSGMEVAKRYLEMQGDNAAPMIMLTAEATTEAMEECKAAGMKAFLTKPIDPEMLFETIGALTGATHKTSDEARDAAPGTTTDTPHSDQPVLDVAVLEELAAHAYSPSFVADIVDSVESDLGDLVERLESAVRNEDWSEVAEIRHAIEGTARGSGATAIVDLIGNLQELAQLNASDRQERVATLRRCVENTLLAMRRFLGERSVKRGIERTVEVLSQN